MEGGNNPLRTHGFTFLPLIFRRMHRRDSHGAKKRDPFRPSSSLVSEARYHRCRHRGCDTAVLCDRHFIRCHAFNRRGETLTQYCKIC